ncbi:hypothetical protein SAMN04488062_104148 [Flavobacterium omnivorum]|uniref:DUF3185 domain-containing protein n=1 Tax=Flavobacterium omnivorum TaxID=178355 RepID=A0A1G7ZPS2_9FLAO|nr:hypothetical protein [Flavobacterium omnivorum]SDH10678.1 hypothetical protein SAMN04488062_104148 [Flavobacterium omnivorum]
MKSKSIGIILIILGIIMVLYNSFNFTTTEKVVDIGPIEINKEVNHPMAWSPIIGIVLAVGGVVLLGTGTTKKA